MNLDPAYASQTHKENKLADSQCATIIILDGLSIGALPSADPYGHRSANTLAHV